MQFSNDRFPPNETKNNNNNNKEIKRDSFFDLTNDKQHCIISMQDAVVAVYCRMLASAAQI